MKAEKHRPKRRSEERVSAAGVTETTGVERDPGYVDNYMRVGRASTPPSFGGIN